MLIIRKDFGRDKQQDYLKLVGSISKI